MGITLRKSNFTIAIIKRLIVSAKAIFSIAADQSNILNVLIVSAISERIMPINIKEDCLEKTP